MMQPPLRPLLSDDYFPFGSQYYRAPSPPPEDWDRDLAHMADIGFNTVKYWIQWRWNHPEPDTFYFDDIDRLMDLAGKHGLKVMLNTIVDVAPAWIYQEHPDASMVTLDGQRIGPQTQPHRQIGGLGICYNHEQVMDHLFRFLRACIERYNDHPALEIWNVGSEPELTSSMAEMRKWAYDAERIGEMLCHCERCESAFKEWLATRYDSIDALNTAWNRNYRSFDAVELPKTRNTFNDIIDWRMFFVETLRRHMKRRFEVAETTGEGKHPVMCHHVFLHGFPTTSTANDPWNVGQFGDLHGITQMDDPMMCDVLRSCARDKPIISAEMLMLMGYTLDLPQPIGANDIKRNIFTGIAANLKGFIFWQFRPELLGREAPTWGLTHVDGSATPQLEAFAEVGRALNEHTEFLLEAEPAPAEIALLYHPQNEIFGWAASGTEASTLHSLLGAHKAFYEHNYNVDFIHPGEVDRSLLEQYKVIYLPFAYVLGKELIGALKEWVHAGGVLIGEAYTAGWDIERGRHHTTVPGGGLHEVFQVRQKEIAPAAKLDFALAGAANASSAKRAGSGGGNGGKADGGTADFSLQGFRSLLEARQPTAAPARDPVEITVSGEHPTLKEGATIYGSMVRSTFFLEGGEALARYSDGSPAATHAEYGSGHAILIGSYIALAAQHLQHGATLDFIAGLAAFAGTDAPARAETTADRTVRADILRSERGEAMLIIRNLTGDSTDETIHLPSQLPEGMTEIFSGKPLGAGSDAGAGSGADSVKVTLEPKEVMVFHG